MSSKNLKNKIDEISLNSHSEDEDLMENSMVKWGLPLKELYKLSLSFYKEKSGKAIHLSYEENLRLVAFSQQAKFGPAKECNLKESLGMFDVIGKDRRNAWENLGDLTKYQSMEGFIDLLDRLCPIFRPFVEAIKKDREEKLRKKIEEEKLEAERAKQERERLEQEKRLEEEKNQEEIKKRQLQDLLNQQTYTQFREYADKQYPSNPEQQALLILQLQNEHYHQYIQQLQIFESERNKNDGANEKNASTIHDNILNEKEASLVEEKENCDSDESGEYSGGIVEPASMWVRHDIKEFKKEVIANGKGDGIIRVNHGDTLTVRVPTLEGGSSLFWEFATDSYDIGFGVYFEWGIPDSNEVTVHISESDDEDDILEEEDEEITCIDDLESGSTGQLQPTAQNPSNFNNRPPLSIIIPVYRRECQNEVYAGSHNYPGQGTYLLKFDNSFSLWRSKTLYYRVFYAR